MAVDVESVLAPDGRMFGRRPKFKNPWIVRLIAGGTGYLAGEYPEGITTLEGEPTEATVRVLARSADPMFDGVVVAEVPTKQDGTWRVDNLNPNMRYDVVGRKFGFNDVMKANVAPSNPPRIFDSRVKAYIGLPLDHTLKTYGGVEPLVVNLESGSLPEGVALADNTLSGSWPTGSTGEYSLSFIVTDANGDQTSKQAVIELILLALEMTASREAPESALINSDIQPITYTATGGEGPYTFSTTGTLPPGMSFDPATAELSGIPDTAGTYSFAVRVTDERDASVDLHHDIEVMEPAEVLDTNLALDKSVDSNNDISYQNDSSSPVNGDIDTENYTSYGSGESWLSVDLDGYYNINRIKVWFYWKDGRTYQDKRVQYSVDGVNWISVYDDTVDPVYEETADGKEFVFTKDVARYVRVVTNGSASNGGNHVVEIEAYLSEAA